MTPKESNISHGLTIMGGGAYGPCSVFHYAPLPLKFDIFLIFMCLKGKKEAKCVNTLFAPPPRVE